MIISQDLLIDLDLLIMTYGKIECLDLMIERCKRIDEVIIILKV